MMIEGTGIGLSICKKLMNMMGGQIGFESEFGVGSTFWIDLLAGMESEASETLGKHVNMLRQAARLKGIRILYVEDHMASIRLMSEVTQIIPDCEFIVATNAPDGVALAKSVRPDLILLDINLPGPQGFDALEQLKNDKRTRKIPVIAVSATATKATIERGKKAGLDDFLSKPLYLEQLFRAIDSVYR
jgi:CheY-like chemotaxis protein